MKYVTKL